MDFSNKVCLITGGARGIGKEIALEFARRKATVVICDVNAEVLEEAKKEISQYSQAESFVVDVTDLSQVENMVDKIIDKISRIDILINNAGITRDNLTLRLKPEDWAKVIGVNLTGVFNCSKAVLKYMVKQKYGKVVNISSVIALMGNPGQVNYGASKAGIIGLTKSLSKEVASRNICVNAVAPGYIQTEMTEKLSPRIKEKMLEMIPQKRFGLPKDIASGVMFLASPYADYITGKVLIIDGGML